MKTHRLFGICLFLLLLLRVESAISMSQIPEPPFGFLYSAYMHKSLRTLSEDITISIDSYEQATFDIVYTVQSTKSDSLIVLFLNYEEECSKSPEQFHIWIDNKEMTISNWSLAVKEQREQEKAILWRNDFLVPEYYDFEGFYFLETHLTDSTHTIRIQYIADVHVSGYSFLNHYSYRYYFDPYNKSGLKHEVKVALHIAPCKGTYQLSLGDEKQILKSTQEYTFSTPPPEICIDYTPDFNCIEKTVIAIHPFLFSLIILLATIGYHIYRIMKYRKKYPQRFISPVMFWGSLIVPFTFPLSFVIYLGIINLILGSHAYTMHSGITVFFLSAFSLIAIPFYLLLTCFFDSIYKVVVKYRNQEADFD